VKCREMREEREGRSVSASVVALDGKGEWGAQRELNKGFGWQYGTHR
jgi:hypothetical protein